LASLKSALLMCVALASSIIAPAKAGPSAEPIAEMASAAVPQVQVEDLLDPQGQPQLTAPQIESQKALTTPDAAVAEPAPVKPTGDLASMVSQLRGSIPGSRELECLAVGIYYESKSEPLVGQLAVGQVIANRASSGGRFPSSYCGVLFQRGQFSFIRGRSLPSVPRASKQWHTAVAMAKIVDQKLHESSVGKALFFHARRVSPGWRLKRVASIGNHIFYR
jgi:spore germination cell wall hydrolase CwlJ-like protein